MTHSGQSSAFIVKSVEDRATPRLIARRGERLNPDTATNGQSELFSVYRQHPVFTNSAMPLLTADAHHRNDAIVEHAIADLKHLALVR